MFLISWKSPESELHSRSFPRAPAAPLRGSEGWELQPPRLRARLLPAPSCQPLAPGTRLAQGLPRCGGPAAHPQPRPPSCLPAAPSHGTCILGLLAPRLPQPPRC